MGKRFPNLVIDRGMALHKMIRLITIASAGSGYLNFMGNEFGHPEWIDFPREGNNYSYHYARRQWSLVDDHDLRYHFLADFDRDMLSLIKQENCFLQSFPFKRYANETDQVLAFERETLLFVFNFHPSKSFADYAIPAAPGKYQIILTSDDLRYGGFGRIEQSMYYFTQRHERQAPAEKNYLKLYLPSRTVSVWKKLISPS